MNHPYVLCRNLSVTLLGMTTTETDRVLELNTLRAEISDLNARLIAADKEKAQAGQLGLHLLKEKEQLEHEHEALIREYEGIKIELEKTQKVPIQNNHYFLYICRLVNRALNAKTSLLISY